MIAAACENCRLQHGELSSHYWAGFSVTTIADLDDFVTCYHPENRHDRKATWSPETPSSRWRVFPYDELIARDKVNLDIFWLRDESLEDSANLPAPDILAAEIVEDLQAALEQFKGIEDELGSD